MHRLPLSFIEVRPIELTNVIAVLLLGALQHGFPFRIGQASIMLNWANLELDNGESTFDSMQESLDWHDRFNTAMDKPYFQGLQADQLLKHNRPAEALAVLDDAIGSLNIKRSFYWEPELLRLKAKAQQELREPSEVVANTLKAATAKAIEQHSLNLELRARRDLFLLRHQDGPAKEEHSALEEVLSRFTEGTKLPEYIAASQLVSNPSS